MVLWLLLLAGPLRAESDGFPLTLKDDLGVSVTLKAPPRRIVSMAPSLTEMLFAVGAGREVVGVTNFCDYPPEAKSREKVGGFSNPSLEKVVALKPDLVLVARYNPMEVIEGLRRLGVNVSALNPSTVDEVLEAVGTVGRLTGHRAESDSLTARLRARIAQVVGRVREVGRRPRVLWGKLEAPTYTAGPGSFIGDLIAMAGGANVASDAGVAWPEFGIEAIVAKDPEVIVTSSGDAGQIPALVEAARRAEGWREVTAVKRGAVCYVNLDLIGRPGPRIVDGLETLARTIHPELFK